jgi:hypothetical protein
MEFEVGELGMVALIALVLFPGVLWISRGKGTRSTIFRAATVGTLLLGAVTIESSMDQAAKRL